MDASQDHQEHQFSDVPPCSQSLLAFSPFDVPSARPAIDTYDFEHGCSSSVPTTVTSYHASTRDSSIVSGCESNGINDSSGFEQLSSERDYQYGSLGIITYENSSAFDESSCFPPYPNNDFNFMANDANTSVPSNLGLDYSGSNQAIDTHAQDRTNLSTKDVPEGSTAADFFIIVDKDGRERYHCGYPDCGKSCKRMHDLNRHKLKHDPEAKEHACGCCMRGSMGWKRFDKLLKHKAKAHGCDKSVQLRFCRRCDSEAASPNRRLWFCTEDGLRNHLRCTHGLFTDEVVDGSQYFGTPSATESSYTYVNSTRDSSQATVTSPLSNSNKRTCGEQHDVTSKKIRHQAVMPIPEPSLEAQTSDVYRQAIKVIDDCSIELKLGKQADWIETRIQNVNPSEFFKFSIVFDRIEQHLKHSSRNDQKQPSIAFNISHRLIKLRGMAYLATSLKVVLEQLVGSDQALTTTNKASKLKLGYKVDTRHSSDHRLTSLKRQMLPLHAVNDSKLLTIWRETAIPMLRKLLKNIVGSDYSASFVQMGDSEETLQAVIQIRVPRLPSALVRSELRKEVLSLFPLVLTTTKVYVEFSQGHLHFLAGGREQDDSETEDDEDDYPHFQRYWKYPGMGASIGLKCNRERSATLGCYVDIDQVPHILTVDHFISQSLAATDNSSLDTATVVSPALLELDEMRENFQLCKRDIEEQIRICWEANFGEDDTGASALRSQVQEIQILNDKLEIFDKELSLLAQPEENLRLATVRYRSSQEEDAGTRDSKLTCSLDWALCEVFPDRAGENRHRFIFDEARNETDFISGDVNGRGAGEAFHAIGRFQPGDLVYFVGQTSGFQYGYVSPAPSLVCEGGFEHLEWQIVPIVEQQHNRKRWSGDSGATVIRCQDRTIVGMIWGQHGLEPLLYFTPIQNIIADIKLKAGTDNVHLTAIRRDTLPPPLATRIRSEIERICRVKQKGAKPRRYRSATLPMKKPKVHPVLVTPFNDKYQAAMSPPRNQDNPSNATTKIFSLPMLKDLSLLATAYTSTPPGEKSPRASFNLFDDCKENKADLTYIVNNLIKSTKSETAYAPKSPLLPRASNTWPKANAIVLEEDKRLNPVTLLTAA